MADQHAPARKLMPRPTCREAPEFKQETPQNLIRFLEYVEDLFQDCGITDAAVRKKWLGRYADTQSEAEWKAMPGYATATWDDFKRELISNYPEALEAVEGSVTKLERVCKANSVIGIRDVAELRKLKREFMAIACKLMAVNPPVVSNRELVKMFMGALDDNFAGQIYSRLSITGVAPPAAAAPINNAPDAVAAAVAAERRREDMYTIEQVIKVALDLAEGASTMFATNYVGPAARTTTVKAETAIKQELDEVKGEVAAIKDRIIGGETSTKQGFANLTRLLQQSAERTHQAITGLNQRQQKALVGAPSVIQPTGATQSDVRNGRIGTPSGACHYCHKTGHYIPECKEKEQHEREGKIKIIDGKAYMVDNSPIPYHPPEKSMKDKVEEFYERQRAHFWYSQIGSMNEAMDVLPNSEPTMSIYTNSVVDSRDDRIHHLTEQLRGMGSMPEAREAAAPSAPPSIQGLDTTALATQFAAFLSSQLATTRSGNTDKQSGF